MLVETRLTMGAFAAVGLLGACFVIAYTAQVHSSYGDPAIGLQAFTATQRVVYYSGRSADRPELREETFAQRADGSYARTFTVRSPEGDIGRALEAVDLRERANIVAEPFTQSRMTMYLSGAEIRQQRGAARSGCLGLTLDPAPRSRILGQEVVLAAHKSKTELVELFVAPELNCFPLHKTRTSPGGSRVETTTSAVELGDPPDSAFQPPSGYFERSPAQVDAAYRARFAGRRLWSAEALRTLEERYWNHQGR